MEIESIGTVRSTRTVATDDHWDDERATIELDAERFSQDALRGLDGFSHLEVIYYFDDLDPGSIVFGARRPRNNPRWPEIGIFAQRGRNRPNRLAISVCAILEIDGVRVTVSGLDAIDGTPVIDLKPYMEEFGPRGTNRQPAWSRELMAEYW